MLHRLRSFVICQMYHPGPLGMAVNPYYHARRGLARHIKDLAPRLRGAVLDVGCGQTPYRHFFTSAGTGYVGMELDTPVNRATKRADVFYNGQTFPFDDASFDAVVFFQVLEHVFNPDRFLGEVARVLRDGGQVLLTVPFVWDEHEQPHDYARYSSFGLRHLLASHGLEVVEHRKSVADVRVIFQLINAYLYKKTYTPRPYLNLACTMILMTPFNVLGSLLALVLPRNEDLYLDNVVLARRRPRG